MTETKKNIKRRRQYDMKPCPFCGGKAHMEYSSRSFMNGKSTRVSYVYCEVCNSRSPKFDRYEFNPHSIAEGKAVEAWNRRWHVDLREVEE